MGLDKKLPSCLLVWKYMVREYTLGNGERYEGKWINDNIEGQGTYYCANGR